MECAAIQDRESHLRINCDLQEGVAEHNETFGVFEDLNVDDPRWHKAGDIR